MAAPKGNNYWQFSEKHGRDFKYTPEALWKEALDYFELMDSSVWNKKEAIKSGDLAGTVMDVPTQTPMSIESFCLFADISKQTFFNYERKEGYEVFFDVIARVRSVIESNQFEGATVGVYSANIIARKLGLADKHDLSNNGGAFEQPQIQVSLNSKDLNLSTE